MKVRRALGYEKSITSILLEIMLYSYLMNPQVYNVLALNLSFFVGAVDGDSPVRGNIAKRQKGCRLPLGNQNRHGSTFVTVVTQKEKLTFASFSF